MSMHKCIYTKEEFESASGEHILQNFLGPRWVSSEIVSNSAQELFGKEIDLAFSKSFEFIRNQIDAKTSRGRDAPTIKKLRGDDLSVINLQPGGKPEYAQPKIVTTELEDGRTGVQVICADPKMLPWAYNMFSEMFPESGVTLKDFQTKYKRESGLMNESFSVKISFGGKDYFRGAMKSAFNLLGVNNKELALQETFDPVRDFILNGVGESHEFVSWPKEITPGLPTISDFSHLIIVYSNGTSVEGFMRLYGCIEHLFKFTDEYNGEPFCYSFLVDPLRLNSPCEIRNSDKVTTSSLPSFDSGANLPNEYTWAFYKGAIKEFGIATDKNNLTLNFLKKIKERLTKLGISDQDSTNICEDFKPILFQKLREFNDQNQSEISAFITDYLVSVTTPKQMPHD
ncbi:hypothetical protein J9231_02055 [Providencia rettgeri]|uniref:hypothetical protein n=1 Tax=Providencia rettgeri TaxID=587 RepID=UPI001B376F0E|nr:hypothetical protein [Providencia rettgeri]MBQ0326636.1 hypothetical protein [Providencia rettgeri]